MNAEHRQLLERRYDVERWYGRSELGERTVSAVAVLGTELDDWSLVRSEIRVREHGEIHSMWSRGGALDPQGALLAIDLAESRSVLEAHDRLLETLGDMKSDAIELRLGEAPGDVAFGLNDTMMLFARANVVVLLRNAGREMVDVQPVARVLDARIVAQGRYT